MERHCLQQEKEKFITTNDITVNHYPDSTKSRSSYLNLLELSVEDFNNLSNRIKAKVFEIEDKQRQMSLETIAHIIMSGEIKVYLNQDEEYQIYGRTKNIYKDLQNLGFTLSEKNYTMGKEDFERIFPNEVKEFISEYSNKKSDKTVQQEEQEESVYEEYEEELG